uniref:G_PROTEIN_RECEP_F1_2 domain-containing protein n=1 Tax=Caenorhabditis tropicalis TaxID=1561998 RepID=A0A1I7SZQ3_9PELO
MDYRTLNLQFIAVYKVAFFVFGTIGNLLFIHLIVRKKQLQSRTSILQCFQCFFHLFCQLGTLLDGVFEIGNKLNRSECFDRIGFYVFFQAAQGLIMVIIVLDILVFVKFTTLYRNLSSLKYTIFTATPIILFSFATAFYGWLSRNDNWIPSCSPPFIFDTSASILYKYIFIFFSLLVLILYIILIRAFYQRSQSSCQIFQKTIKRLQLSVVIYIATWFFSQIFGLIVLRVTEYSVGGGMIFAHNSLFICLSYSNTFYVTMWRSKEYRDQFYSVWCPKLVRISTIPVIHVSLISPKSTVTDRRRT